MSTKPPLPPKEAPADVLEKIAYGSVEGIPAREPNDLHRLGYNVWGWLKDRKGTLEQAVTNAGARLLVPQAEAAATIRKRLLERGMQLD